MRKLPGISTFICALLFIAWNSSSIFAQVITITVPDYTYGMINSEYGTVTTAGVANPGPYGGYSVEEVARTSGVAFAHGYRWWGYPSYPLLICGKLPKFDFPGDHGVVDMSSISCGNPPIGHMGSWGGVIIDPELRKIWCLTGAKKSGAPTAAYCIPNPYGPGQICYNLPPSWGKGESYGYIRKAVVIKSTGSLQKGDPVNIKVKLTVQGISVGDGTVTCQGVLFMNREGNPMEYMRYSDMSDFFMAPMIARFCIDLNGKDSSTVTMAVGDTIRIETGFENRILHDRDESPVEAEGWAGNEPHNLMVSRDYVRTDSVKKFIKKYGNCLTYDLVCLTQGAELAPLTASGPNVDEDKDGLTDSQEKGVYGDNSSFDGNADGIPDYKQPGVGSFRTFDGQNYATIVVPSGAVLSQMKVTDNPSKADTPADAEFPFGFFDISIDGLDPGEGVDVTLILHNGTTMEKYYKYGPTPDNVTPHWYEFSYNGQTGAEINGNIIRLHFADGLRGDEDLTVNGSVKDPGGPAISGTTGMFDLAETDGILVYPNPANDHITFRIPEGILAGGSGWASILDLSGKYVKNVGISELSGNQGTIDISDIPEGMYVLRLTDSKISYNLKIIKLK